MKEKNYIKTLKNRFLEKRNKLYSKEHVLADDLSNIMAEPKKFAAYLGIAKLYNETDLRILARHILEKKDLLIERRGRYFFGALRRLTKKSGVKFKNTNQKNELKERLKKVIASDSEAIPKK